MKEDIKWIEGGLLEEGLEESWPREGMKDLAARLLSGEDEVHLPKLKSYGVFGKSRASPAFIGSPLLDTWSSLGKVASQVSSVVTLPVRELGGAGNVHTTLFAFFFSKFPALELV